MSNTLQAIINSPYADNYILYSFLFFLHFTGLESGTIDVDIPISRFDQNNLLVAVTFMELHQGIDIPDEMLLDKTKTLRQMADEIRILPKLKDTEFQQKLLLDLATWRTILDMN